MALGGGQAFAQNGKTIEIVRDFRGKPVTLKSEIFLPKNAGEKAPALIILHGSGGVRAVRELAYARQFNDLGIIAVVADSFSGRGITSTVRDQDQISSYDMLVDTAAIARMVARDPRVDPKRIGLIGFSKGGTSTIKAALQSYIVPLAKHEFGFSLLIALYPWCGDMPHDFSPADSSLYMLLGEDDTYSGTESCREYAFRLKEAGGSVVLKTYPMAKHDWDTPAPTDWFDARGQNYSKCIYDEAAKGIWVERSSKITVRENDKPTGNGPQALARCMTLGVRGGYNREVHMQSLKDIRGFIREAFQLK